MKRYAGPLVVGVLLAAFLFSSECNVPTDDAVQPAPLKASMPRIATTTYNVTTKAKPVIKRACLQCHAVQQPDGRYPADVEMHPGSPWTIVMPTGTDYQTLQDAICDGRAPANRALTGGEYDTLADYFINTLGASPSTCTVPSTFYWSQDDHESGLTLTGSPYQAGGYFGFAVEALIRPDMDWSTFNESGSGGHNNLSMRLLNATYYSAVPTDSFTHSNDATFYISPNGVAYNGNLRDTEMRGYFHVPSGSGHRFFVGMHTQIDREGPSNTTRRNSRTYVRFQIEQDGSTANIALRMKKTGFTDENETVGAWLSNSGPGDMVADPTGSYSLFDYTGALKTTWLYYYKFYSFEDGNGTHYRGEVWDGDPDDTNLTYRNLLGSVGGVRSNKTLAFGGTFIQGWYERRDTDKSSGVGKTIVSASSMEGAGTGHSSCHDCELDRPGAAPLPAPSTTAAHRGGKHEHGTP